jgi:hypothetical protein
LASVQNENLLRLAYETRGGLGWQTQRR